VFADGDAADREAFWAEADNVEEQARRATEERANRAEAAAMVIETDALALKAARQAASALALDPVTKKALGAQLALSPERWSERFIDVIADALLNTRRYRDMELVLEPLDASTRDLILQRRFELVFSMHAAIGRALDAFAPRGEAAAIKSELTQGMFTPETLRLLFREALRAPAPGIALNPAPLIDLDVIARDLAPVLAALGPGHLDVILEVIPAATHEGLRRPLFAYIERVLPGREPEIVDRMMTFDLDLSRPLLRLLAASKRPSALEALRRLAGCASPTLRCEAIAMLATSPEQLRDELAELAESPQPDLRLAALRTLAFHQVKAAGPLLVRRVQDASFHQLALDERREVLAALASLNPARAEAILIELLQKHGLITTEEPLEQTRVVAVELLGKDARSMEALQAALGAMKRRWWNSQPLRDRAQVAAEAFAARLGRRVSESGELL